MEPVTDETDVIYTTVKRCNDKEDPLGLVEADEIIAEELLKRGLAYHEQISWRELCFHSCNRGGTLCSPSEVTTLMDDVDYVGVSMKMLAHAVCAEVAPDDDPSVQKTREWVRQSSRTMAEVVPGSIKFATLACGHFTQGARSILAKKASANR